MTGSRLPAVLGSLPFQGGTQECGYLGEGGGVFDPFG